MKCYVDPGNMGQYTAFHCSDVLPLKGLTDSSVVGSVSSSNLIPKSNELYSALTGKVVNPSTSLSAGSASVGNVSTYANSVSATVGTISTINPQISASIFIDGKEMQLDSNGYLRTKESIMNNYNTSTGCGITYDCIKKEEPNAYAGLNFLLVALGICAVLLTLGYIIKINLYGDDEE